MPRCEGDELPCDAGRCLPVLLLSLDAMPAPGDTTYELRVTLDSVLQGGVQDHAPTADPLLYQEPPIHTAPNAPERQPL
jgi:hypothetical protein